MKAFVFLFAAVIPLVAMNGCKRSGPAHGANSIICTKERPWTSLFGHLEEVNIITIDGRRFEHVRGLSRFYIPMPQINAILFLTDEKDHSVTYHVFKMDTGEDIPINAKLSVFGFHLGSTNVRDFIQQVSSCEVVLYNVDKGAKSVLPELSNLDRIITFYYLDLNKKVATDKTLYYDKAGNIILER